MTGGSSPRTGHDVAADDLALDVVPLGFKEGLDRTVELALERGGDP